MSQAFMNFSATPASDSEDTEKKIDKEFLRDVLAGLDSHPKTLPCKYFYDEVGSQLFEKICTTDEYYVTRTELEILENNADQMAALVGPQAHIIEPGAGSVKKIGTLLTVLDKPKSFSPLDISPEILFNSTDELRELFPNIDMKPRVIDFLNNEELASALNDSPEGKRVIFFPGSTIGNFSPTDAEHFLKSFSDHLNPGDGMIIGVDLVKETSRLEAAYNDTQGVTAAFNMNLLFRINNELQGNFDTGKFQHKAFFNEIDSRIEMHLESKAAQTVEINEKHVSFEKGESIHTENSYKYSIEDFSRLAAKASFTNKAVWLDENDLFSIHYLEVL